MAGIGFTLRKLVDRGGCTLTAGAYAYAALLASGPWVMAVFSLAVFAAVANACLPGVDREAFFAQISYTFAFSLILTGPIQLIVTRYSSDRLYEDKREAVIPALLAALVLAILLATLVAVPALFALGFSLAHSLVLYTFFVTVSCLWICVVMLSAVKAYLLVAGAFVVSHLLSIVLMILGGSWWGTVGAVAGYAAGQQVLLGTLLIAIGTEFPMTRLFDLSFLGYFREHRYLALFGFLYSAAIWADKLVFWFHPSTGQAWCGFLRTAPFYDTMLFVAFLSVVPGLGILFLRVETDLEYHQHAMIGRIRGHYPLGRIRESHRGMINAVRQGIIAVVCIQGSISFFLLLLAPTVLTWLHFSWFHLPIFRFALIGAFLQLILLHIVTGLFYLDEARPAAVIAGGFLLANAACSYLSIAWGDRLTYGIGYAAAVIIVLFPAYFSFQGRLRSFDHRLFSRQAA